MRSVPDSSTPSTQSLIEEVSDGEMSSDLKYCNQ